MPRSRMTWRLVWTALVLICVSGSIVTPGSVKAAEPSRVSGSLDLSRYSGVAQPDQVVTLAAPADGLLFELQAREGDQVRSGQILGKLDDRVQSAVVHSATLRVMDMARIEQAAAQVSILEFDYAKAEELHDKGVANKREADIAKVKLQEAEAALRGVTAEHEQLTADLEVEKQKLESLHLTAPFPGIVLEKLAESGTALRLGDGVYRIAALNPLRVELPLPVELYTQLVAGQTYTLVAARPVDHDVPATLRSIRPEIDSASQTFVVTFEIANADLKLPAGFRVHLQSATSQD